LSSRRSFLAAPLLALAGCGFQPVYGPGGGANPVATGGALPTEPGIRQALASVRVNIIPERNGQVLRRTLQRSLEGLEPGTQGRYGLDVFLTITVEALGYRRDGLVTRIRYVAITDWVLSTLGIAAEVVERGRARTLDSFNLPDLQFFASDASREDAERRMSAELSDRVLLGVALALRRRLPATPTA
jgi:LPS-assembly lipoprotein